MADCLERLIQACALQRAGDACGAEDLTLAVLAIEPENPSPCTFWAP